MFYINYKDMYNGSTETVDEFENRREANEAVREYRVSDKFGNYWVSTRSTKEWRERK